jgi:hypothetical protein
MSVGNVVMVFEGTCAQYLKDQVPRWTRFSRDQVREHHLQGRVELVSRQRHQPVPQPECRLCLGACLAGSDPCNALPSYWSSENTAITAGCYGASADGSAVTLP